ncbi:MAG TPA: excinuclease ABC subunit UvrC [Bacteroidales bacterium]|nr:excinuclease ABC subunit UvrC [Bacteroidales bacterium]HOR81761.1 excinuclease ABC subunit UvrC [Bacteroidales bacterium]HPJ92129.1 excinuclease ABC subunit UvrC [Bacteroidales bacterium]
MSNNNTIVTAVKTLPEKSGVYLYYDSDKNIIYVGKAKNLRKRVGSYFTKTQTNPKLRIMVGKIFDIKFIIVDNEYEALLLENNLIKKHQPRYNVLLKDDKTYPWICIPKEDFPRIFSTRKTNDKKASYFGPYSSVKNMGLLLEILRELYPFRTCNLNLSKENIAKNKYRPCLDYHLKKCKAPCVGLQTEDDYLKNIKQAINIIEGNIKDAIKELESEMFAHSKKMEFEKAHEFKNKIDLLKNYQIRSTIVNPKINNVDVFAIAEDTNSAYISYFKVMNGAIIYTQNLEIKKRLDESIDELLLLAIVDIRKTSHSQTPEIILPFLLPYAISDTKITVPKKGDKFQLLALAQRNALAFKQDRQIKKSILEGNRSNKNTLEQMQKDLMLSHPPAYIECFDNSNIQGKYAVSAMVCFRNAKPSKKEYRHYLIKTQQQPNDYASMQEVVYRRYSKLLKEKLPLPDMIFIDGGKGQVSAVYTVLEQLGIENKVALFGIAERLEEVFRPKDPLPLYIDKKSETQYVLQHLRDEAHRFGITHHRKLRSNETFKTELTNIQGVGDMTAQKLLKHFHSIEKIKKAEVGELAQVIGRSKAIAVFNFYRSII